VVISAQATLNLRIGTQAGSCRTPAIEVPLSQLPGADPGLGWRRRAADPATPQGQVVRAWIEREARRVAGVDALGSCEVMILHHGGKLVEVQLPRADGRAPNSGWGVSMLVGTALLRTAVLVSAGTILMLSVGLHCDRQLAARDEAAARGQVAQAKPFAGVVPVNCVRGSRR